MSSYKKLSHFGEKSGHETSDVVPKILRKEDKENLIRNFKVVVIDVFADWCGPCKIISPLFSSLFPKYNIPGICILAKENVDLALSPSIQVVPSFQFYLNGTLDSVISGADITLVENKIIELINSVAPTPTPGLPKNNNPPHHPSSDSIPPQLSPQFQYQKPHGMITSASPSMPMPTQVSPSVPPNSTDMTQSQNEGFQHAQQSRQQYYEQPAHLPMHLPIRRK